ncbi:hypothetical protein V2J09_014291 [Rumex salicifolius]
MDNSGSIGRWMVLSVSGDKPMPRFDHAATVIGNKMVVVGGECGNTTLDDVQVLNFDQFSWTTASSKIYFSPTGLPLKIPASKGHSLVSWGKIALLVGGKTDPSPEKLSVWAFDTETECWSLMEAKGDVPIARSGHTAVRVGSHLILFGGEDSKRRKLNDLHMFDLKSMTWLPLHCTGTGPSPRSNHVASIYDDKILFIFGGSSKSKPLNDLYSLDFEKMIWSRVKAQGSIPSPRSGSCSILCGSKWYITGGGSRKIRHGETLVFDVLKNEWSVLLTSSPYSITTNKGFSLVLVQHKEKDFLVAFGGFKTEPSNQVEVLFLEKNEYPSFRHEASNKATGKPSHQNRTLSSDLTSQLNIASSCIVDYVARQNLASIVHEHGSSRRSLSNLSDHNPPSGSVSLRKQLNEEEALVYKLVKTSLDDISFMQLMENRNMSETRSSPYNSGKVIKEVIPNSSELEKDKLPLENESVAPSTIYELYETKIAELMKRNGVLEGQLAAALAGCDAADNNLSSSLKSRQDLEMKLHDTEKETEFLKDKLARLEAAHEETNNLSNLLHSDNVRLEHDVAFLKAELHSTRGALTNERARAFHLQVEVFHHKQRLQSLENRASTPRKPL